ncbi:MAG: transposase family protein [Planctomycetota bacterium]
MPAWLLLDTSASMAVTSVARSKYAIALHIAGGLALACLDRVSPVGVLGTGDRELRIEPSLSRQMGMQWLVQLRRFRYDEATSLAAKVTELNASLNCPKRDARERRWRHLDTCQFQTILVARVPR